MSATRELIAQLEQEDESRHKEYEKHFTEQYERYEEMQKKMEYYKDKNKKHMDSIIKGLQQLTANKHTIKTALEQTDSPVGLPIPHEHQNIVVDFMSKATVFINDASVTSNPNNFSPDEIHEDLISKIENVASDLKNCNTEVIEARALHESTRILNGILKQLNDATVLDEEDNRRLDSTFDSI